MRIFRDSSRRGDYLISTVKLLIKLMKLIEACDLTAPPINIINNKIKCTKITFFLKPIISRQGMLHEIQEGDKSYIACQVLTRDICREFSRSALFPMIRKGNCGGSIDFASFT